MVYILKKSKKTKREKYFRLTTSEAKEFMYKLSRKEFLFNDFFLLGADLQEEFNEMFNHFVPDFFAKDETSAFERFRLNGNIIKPKRLAFTGATYVAIRNFEKKIKKELPEYYVGIFFKDETFEIVVKNAFIFNRLICSYDLVIQKNFVQSTDENDYSEIERINSAINQLFRKQRYYYRRKKRYEEA